MKPPQEKRPPPGRPSEFINVLVLAGGAGLVAAGLWALVVAADPLGALAVFFGLLMYAYYLRPGRP